MCAVNLGEIPTHHKRWPPTKGSSHLSRGHSSTVAIASFRLGGSSESRPQKYTLPSLTPTDVPTSVPCTLYQAPPSAV